MIPRYSPPDMAALFTDAARFELWLEVELLATEAQALLGVVPAEDAAICRAKAPTVDDVFVADVLAREEITNHDVAAFVDVVQERIGPPAGSFIHFGLTSSDVVDTALSATLTRAADLLLVDLDHFVAALRDRALELMHVPVTGRTHGMHAEPTTFGAKFALWALQADRDRRRMRQARDGIAVGKLSGAVGTFSNIDPEVEANVCAALGLEPGAGHPGHRPRSPCRIPVGLRLGRGHRRAHVHRDPPSGPQRGGRGRRALRRRAEGELGHAPQAQPDPLRAPVRPGPPVARLSRRRAGGRGAVARAGHLAQLGGAGGAPRRLPPGLLHPAQGHRPGLGLGHPRRPGAGQPGQRQLRPRLQPVGAAGAGGRRAEPRRGLPHRPARRPHRVGGAPALPPGTGGRPRRDPDRCRARRRLRSLRAPCATPTASPTPWRLRPLRWGTTMVRRDDRSPQSPLGQGARALRRR